MDGAAQRIVSVNVGGPKELQFRDRAVVTSIFKSPVAGRVAVERHNISGDRQSDLRAHGGPYKAVYCYPIEHYWFWRKQLPELDFVHGMFGENLTTEGFVDDVVCIGDRFRVGTAVLEVTQPRMPCYKLGLRVGRADMVKRFWASERLGFYCSVAVEGDVAAADPMERIGSLDERISVREVVRLYTGTETAMDLLERALRAPISGSWKEELREKWAAAYAPAESTS